MKTLKPAAQRQKIATRNSRISHSWKISSLLSFAYLIVLVTISSCKKDELNGFANQNTSQIEQQPEFKVLNGRLYFQDLKTFNDGVQYLLKNQDNVEAFYAMVPGFTSSNAQYLADLQKIDNGEIQSLDQLSAFKSLTMRNYLGEQELAPTIDAVLLGYMVNKDNILQIGDTIYYFTYDRLFEFSNNKYLELNGDIKFDINNADRTYDIHRSIDNQFVEPDNGSRSVIDEFTYNYYTCAVDRRFYGNMETTDAGVYLEIRLTTKHQKKSLGVWVGENVSSISTIGTGEYTGPFIEDPTHYPYDVNKTLSDKNDANCILSSIGGWPTGAHYYFVMGTCSNTHKFYKDCSGALYTNYTSY